MARGPDGMIKGTDGKYRRDSADPSVGYGTRYIPPPPVINKARDIINKRSASQPNSRYLRKPINTPSSALASRQEWDDAIAEANRIIEEQNRALAERSRKAGFSLIDDVTDIQDGKKPGGWFDTFTKPKEFALPTQQDLSLPAPLAVPRPGEPKKGQGKALFGAEDAIPPGSQLGKIPRAGDKVEDPAVKQYLNLLEEWYGQNSGDLYGAPGEDSDGDFLGGNSIVPGGSEGLFPRANLSAPPYFLVRDPVTGKLTVEKAQQTMRSIVAMVVKDPEMAYALQLNMSAMGAYTGGSEKYVGDRRGRWTRDDTNALQNAMVEIAMQQAV